MPITSQIPAARLDDLPLHRFLLESIQKRDPQTIAFIDSDTGKKLTYGALYEFSISLANGLRSVGLRKGDVVVLCMPNRPEYAVIAISVLQCGGVICGMDHGFSEAQISSRLQHSECKFVFTTSQMSEKIKKVASSNQKVLIVDLPPTSKSGSIKATKTENLNSLFYFQDGKEEIDEVGMWTKMDLAVLGYAKSVDGITRGIMLSHSNVVMALQQMSIKFFVQPLCGDHLIGVHPFFDLQGLMILLQSLYLGCTMVTMAEFKAEKYYGLIEKYKVPIIHASPSILIRLAKDPRMKKYDLRSVTTCIARAGHAGASLSERVMKRLKNIKHFVQVYGPAEVCLTSTCTMEAKVEKNHGCGIVLNEMECKIIDSSGQELGENETGQLCIHGPTLMSGYWKDPTATETVISSDGWLHTGDIGFYDDEECFYLLGNKRELIENKGEHISLSDIEIILRLHPQIKDAAIIPDLHVESGNKPTAFIVRERNQHLSAAAVNKYLTESSKDFDSLRIQIEFVNSIPRNSNGDVIHEALKKEVEKNKRQNSKL